MKKSKKCLDWIADNAIPLTAIFGGAFIAILDFFISSDWIAETFTANIAQSILWSFAMCSIGAGAGYALAKFEFKRDRQKQIDFEVAVEKAKSEIAISNALAFESAKRQTAKEELEQILAQRARLEKESMDKWLETYSF